MKESSIIDTIKLFGQTLMRLHVVLFIVFVISGLILAILILNNILTDPLAIPFVSSSSSNSTIIDETTTGDISRLEISTKNFSYQNLPAGRINPFSE